MFGEETQSVRLLFIEDRGVVAFDVHCFLSPAGEILASRKLDPKFLVFESKVRFELKGQRERDANYRGNKN